MAFSLERSEHGEVLLKVAVGEKEVRTAREKAAQLLSQRRTIPGFRRGKAPLNLVERAFGEETVRSQALDYLLPKVVQEAMADADVEAFDNPEVDDINWDNWNGLSLTVKILERPKVKLGNYLEMAFGPLQDPEAGEEEIAQTLEQLRESKAELAPVEDGQVQEDSFLLLDLEVRRDGELVATESAENTLLAMSTMIPELKSALLGAGVGEEREATVPRDDGQFLCRTKIKAIKRKELPPLDDDLASLLGPYASLQELQEAVANTIKRKKEAQIREEREQRVLAALVDGGDISVSAAILARRTEETMEKLLDRMKHEGAAIPADRDEIRRLVRDEEEKKLKNELSLDAVATEEAIDATPAEVEMYLQIWARQTQKPPEWWRDRLGETPMRELRQIVLRDKALTLLVERSLTPAGAEKHPVSGAHSDEAGRE